MIITAKMKTEAAPIISYYDYKKKCDVYCRKLLSNKRVLTYVMKGCVSEYADTPLENVPSYVEVSSINTADCEYIDSHQVEVTDETIPGAQIKRDVQFEATVLMKQKEADKSMPADKKVRIIISLENQTKDDPGYLLIKRALYYCSRLMAKQKYPKNGFQHSDYDRIEKACSIWICIGHNNQKNDVTNTYRIQETCETKIWHAAKKNHDLLTAVMVYPEKGGIREMQNIPSAAERQDENK